MLEARRFLESDLQYIFFRFPLWQMMIENRYLLK